ncbi:serine hydrolase [Cytophaga sp. FL35]|uniref:serine hydrolase n=1 Tax=Cytophaga sp. FL35 TaxID=1904456 RepID=UPI0016538646|nr:serine hydrolase [Cytophaga sp. FL35]MBC6998876.1 serine hydrolase [Cytophaga sp. FL35]
MNRLLALLLVFVSVIYGCSERKVVLNPLEAALTSDHPKIKRVMDSVEQYEVQIRYTQIDRSTEKPTFKDYDLQVNENKYFYPASTVKFPIAVLALEKLNATDSMGMYTKYFVEGDTIESNFAKDVTQIFAVSDNLANNRLVEFMGMDHINQQLTKKGIEPVRFSHRLGYHTGDPRTKPLIVFENDSTTYLMEGSINTTPDPLDLSGIKKGKGYFEEGRLINESFDFSLKNYYPIKAQHEFLKRVVFPEAYPKSEQFELSSRQHEYLLESMHTVPRKVGYDEATYYDGYCKFFMYGDTKERIPDHIKIYNKVGFAYGTLTDCAYIKDEKNNVEFLLTATILVNNNEVFNDNQYEYDEIGIPFLAELGRQIYQIELERTK